MVKQATADRRNSIRAKRVLSIQFRLVKSKRKNISQAWHLSTTQDMSIGGLSFYTDQQYHARDILEIKVVMSGVLDIFNGYGQVVRVERKRMGAYSFVAIKFIPKTGKSRSAKAYLPSKKATHRM